MLMPSQFHIGGGWIRPTTRLAIYLRDGFRCVWCGRGLVTSHPRNVTLDHLTPRERGGSNASTNLVTACKGCNADRGTASILAYARTLADPAAALERVRRQRREELDLARARAILADPEQDPRPVVRRARREGRPLTPKRRPFGARPTTPSLAAAAATADDGDWYGF